MAREALQPGEPVSLVCSVCLPLVHLHLTSHREGFLIHIAKLISRKLITVYTFHCCAYGVNGI